MILAALLTSERLHQDASNPAVQRTGASRLAPRQISHQRLLAPVADPHVTLHMITDDQGKYYGIAAKYLLTRRTKSTQNSKAYPLNRGDILLLVVLIEQEIKATAPCADRKRLAAIREKLGDLV